MSNELSPADYLKEFKSPEKALEIALDIRKFEIDLYWKRAAYFWTFIAAAFAGFSALRTSSDPFLLYLICLVGLSAPGAGIV